MLELIVKVLMALAVVGFIGYPLLKVRQDEEPEMLSEEAEELYRRKESAYSAIKELEFDYRTGKLSESDFHELDAKYRSEAIEILEAIDLLESGEGAAVRPAAERVEEESAVAAPVAQPARARSGRRGRSKISAEPESLTALVCGECGRENPAGSKFCASCGQALVATKAAGGNGNGARTPANECADCGAELDPAHKFCASCGAEVRA